MLSWMVSDLDFDYVDPRDPCLVWAVFKRLRCVDVSFSVRTCQLKEKLVSNEFKTTSCPVTIDFLIRHGIITPQNGESSISGCESLWWESLCPDANCSIVHCRTPLQLRFRKDPVANPQLFQHHEWVSAVLFGFTMCVCGDPGSWRETCLCGHFDVREWVEG